MKSFSFSSAQEIETLVLTAGKIIWGTSTTVLGCGGRQGKKQWKACEMNLARKTEVAGQ